MTTRGHPWDRLVFPLRRLNTRLASRAQKRVTNLVYELAVAYESIRPSAEIFFISFSALYQGFWLLRYIHLNFKVENVNDLMQQVSASLEIDYVATNIFSENMNCIIVLFNFSTPRLTIRSFVAKVLQDLQKIPMASNGSSCSFLQFHSDTYSHKLNTDCEHPLLAIISTNELLSSLLVLNLNRP